MYNGEQTQSGIFDKSEQPLNPRQISQRTCNLLNDVAGYIHASRRQVA